MRAVIRIDPPLVHDVFADLLAEAGLDVVGSAPDWLELLVMVREHRPEVVFLMAGDSSKAPGICSHLLGEDPHLKIVLLSTTPHALAVGGPRTLYCDHLSIESIQASVVDPIPTSAKRTTPSFIP